MSFRSWRLDVYEISFGAFEMLQLNKQIVLALLTFGLLSGTLAAEGKLTSRIASALAAAPKATWVAQGQGQRIIYIIVDPNCGYCQLLYKNLQPFIASHNLQLRWILVAIVDPTSLGKAAAILQAKDPKLALDHNETHYNTKTYAGGIIEEIPSAATEVRLRANEALLNQVGIPVVPTMLFAAKTGEAMMIQGASRPLP